MLPIEIKIDRSDTGLEAKVWREIMATAWERVGVFWHRFILPKHFTREGASEYNYQARVKSYMVRKGRRHGHQDPLVFTGDTRAMATRIRDVRATSKGANVMLKVPKYIWMYKGAAPRKAIELQATSEGDARACAGILDKEIQKGWRNASGGAKAFSGRKAS